jgi:hypothetical protein
MRAGAIILNRAYQQPVAAFTLDYDVETSDIMNRFGLKKNENKRAVQTTYQWFRHPISLIHFI